MTGVQTCALPIYQSGVALALVLIIERTVPSIGVIATPVVLGMIAASDFIGPPLFKRVLLMSQAIEETA